MMSLAELAQHISAHYWKGEQVAAWVEARFFRRSAHQQTSSGSGSGTLPIITLTDGTIDASFVTSTAIAEYIADTAGAMVTGNTETGITVTYQDSDNTLDFALDDEYISDLVGTMVTGNTETDIAVTYQDSDNTLDFVISSTLVGDRIHAATDKATPVDADELGLADSAASFVLKHVTWANLKATLKTYLDTLYGLLAGNNTWSGTNKYDANVTLSTGTQDYVFSDRATSLTLQSQTSGSPALLEIYTKDGDGTDSTQGQYWGVGTPGSVTNRERLLFGWDATNSWYFFNTEKAGTGTLRDVRIYTGTNTAQLIVDASGNVGAGIAATTQLGVKAGTSSNDAAVGGVLYVDTAVTGQVGAGPDVLSTYTVPANTLAVNNQSLWWEAFGIAPVTATGAIITIEFGGTTVLNMSSFSPAGDGQWWASGRIFRTGAATQRSVAKGYADSGATMPNWFSSTTPAETLSGTVVLRVRGDSTTATNNDTVIHAFIIGWDDANT